MKPTPQSYLGITGGLVVLVSLFLLTGCPPTSEVSPQGFRLPKGDAEQGRLAFIELGCLDCHTVVGEDMPAPDAGTWDIQIELGGKITEIKTYGELVTSVINPNHVIDPAYLEQLANDSGESLMPDLTHLMTARQMIDIVEFLQQHYEVIIPEISDYGMP